MADAKPETLVTMPKGATVPAPPISPDVWDAAVGEWLTACVRSSPLSHNVDAWNRLNEVLPKLRDYLNTAMTKEE